MSYRLRNGLVFRPSAEYNLTTNNLVRFRGEIEKRVSKMYISASYERIIQSQNDNLFLSFRYDLPFARTGISSSYSNNRLIFSESAQGSLAFGGGNNHVHTGNNSAISKGGILLYPFLDLNQNGVLDKGEKRVLLSSVGVAGGVAVISKKDSIVRISDLNAFVNYNVNFSDTDLDNISWRFKHNTYQVLVDPNQYKHVFVPIVSVGEVSGMVYMISGQTMKGQARVTLQIYDEKGEKVAETLSEFDGYFSYLGLKPGKYIIRVDEEQLNKLNYQSTPAVYPIDIKISTEGDIVDGLDFNLKAIEVLIPLEKTAVIMTNTLEKSLGMDKQSESHFNTSFGKISDQQGVFYSVQIGIFKNYVSSEYLLRYNPVFYELLPDETVRYISGKYDSKKEAKKARNKIISKGVKDAYIVKYNDGEKIDTSTIRN
jgi:hypothetical protein